ncbi:MAG: LacI family transcriptional regulator, partial [Proteobacteria bacterium]
MPDTQKRPPSSRPHKRITLQDIANVAGVHIMTVSDALNGTGRVAVGTRKKIIQIAQELNYVPNATARALATGRTNRIAILSGALDYPYYANLLHYLKELLDNRNYKMLLLKTPKEIHDLIYSTGSTEADGVIAIDMYDFGGEFGENSSTPCVSIGGHPRSSMDCVHIDLGAGVRQGLKLMIEEGCKRIAYLVTSQHMARLDQSRAKAYYETMEEHGLTPELINLDSGYMHLMPGIFTEYLKKHGAPEGLFCQNDEVAMCAFRTLNDAGFTVPKDVLMLGCDGQLHCSYFEPPLSSVAQPLQEISST